MSRALLSAHGMAKSYGRVRRHRVLRDVTFTVVPSALVGIVGENGAGKSTLLEILAGELCPDSGNIELDGALGYCPQDVILNGTLTVEQHLDYFRAAYRIADLRRAHDLMERLGFTRYRDIQVGTLSGGTKQKLNLTLALMHDPLPFRFRAIGAFIQVNGQDLTLFTAGFNALTLIVGFMLFASTRNGARFDHRLILSGYSQPVLILAKLSALVVAAASIALYASLVLLAFRHPQSFALVYEEFRDDLARLIGEGIENGEFRDTDLEEVALTFLALTEGLTLIWAMNPRSLAWREHANASLALLLEGLRT